MTFYRNEIKKKSESRRRRRTKKTYYILHLEYSWIREFVKIGIFYTKKRVNVFRLIPIPRECIGKNQKNIVRRRRVKERKVMFKNRKDKKEPIKKQRENNHLYHTFFSLDSHILIFPFFHSRTILIEKKKKIVKSHERKFS